MNQVGGLNMQKNTSYFDQWQSLYPLRRSPIQYRTQEMYTRILEYKRKNVEPASSSSVAIQGSTKTVYKDAGTNNTREDLEDLSI